MKKLRRLTAFVLIGCAQLSAHAEVSIVKIINFSCEFCKASEAMDEPIRRAIEATGGRMVYATLPADENADGSRELVYYAARDAMPKEEPLIRRSLFRGAQDLGYPLVTVGQTVEWLNTDLVALKYDWTLLPALAEGRDARAAYKRAIALTVKAGATILPSYVIVRDGALLRTLDVDSAGGTYTALREAVLSAIEKAAVPKPATVK